MAGTTLFSGAAPPPSGAFPFIFSDESGVVQTASTQPFYGIGMIKLSDAGRWNDGLNAILDRARSAIAHSGSGGRRCDFEFKFAKVTATMLPHYAALIDYFSAQSDGYFCSLVIDKTLAGINPIAACGTPWDALITYSRTLFRGNIRPGEQAIIISDNYQKPRTSPKFYERELVRSLNSQIANVCMLESEASMFLQLVDVLLGCVMYHFKLDKGVIATPNVNKVALSSRLAKAYGVKTLAGNLTKSTPTYFSVWKYKPYSPALVPKRGPAP